MKTSKFFHLFANGDDARNFLISEQDFYAAFNRFGLCAAQFDVKVVCFSLEDSHPHGLLYGAEEECDAFRRYYEQSTLHFVRATRGTSGDLNLVCEILEVSDQKHLMNVATYIINQPTKDGKRIMPYDYLWGTGPLYFRSPNTILPWMIRPDGSLDTPIPIRSLSVHERRKVLSSKREVPGDWLVCNGFLLPTNYVSVNLFEKIYVTHNCFRAFLSSGGRNDDIIKQSMAERRGITMDDYEARSVCGRICAELFGRRDVRTLSVSQRLDLGLKMRRDVRLTPRQIATLVRLPEVEIRKYIL
ncbi:MAG: hypothetical protein IJS07_01075 [Bacteroidales bacterium]|nr:hypothetical protein [Bacteroidales bacterium]